MDLPVALVVLRLRSNRLVREWVVVRSISRGKRSVTMCRLGAVGNGVWWCLMVEQRTQKKQRRLPDNSKCLLLSISARHVLVAIRGSR